jgi:hypothetical protein
MNLLIGPILDCLKEILQIFGSSGGPEKLKEWLTGKLPELQAIKNSLMPPDKP